MSRDAVRRALRTFVISTLALFIPGLLGWLNALTEWARGEGSTPFPDAHGLIFLAVAAITGGVIALVNLAWNVVEDASGKGMLRTPQPPPGRNEGGYLSLACACNDGSHDLGTALWHRAYCRWYDHDRAGNTRRAAAWGWVTDRLVRLRWA